MTSKINEVFGIVYIAQDSVFVRDCTDAYSGGRWLPNAPANQVLGRSRELRRRINRPPSAQYSALSERVRISTPAALQCALFCGGASCQYELPPKRENAIQGLYSDWVTEDILAMARPSTASIAARNIIQQFHSWGIRTVVNLQTSGEHASCGPPLTSSGFTYDPTIFMANNIYYYNFAWPDYGEASLSGLLNMTKVLSFALQEGRVAIHCHAEPKSGVCRCKTKLHGKTALVTGGNSGIGLETARDLAGRGARVIIACRNEEKSKQAIADIIETTGNNNVEYRHLNLCKFSSIREFADNFNKTVDRLDLLVNNAGCAGLPLKISDDGLDLVLQTNHFGPFLLTNLLMDKLIASMPSRIIIVSSFLHNFGRLDINDLGDVNTKGYYFTKYANSKLCNLLWMKALVKRLPSGVTVNSLHPGFVWTNIFKRLHPLAEKLVYILTTLMFKDSKEGAQTSIHLCVCPELSLGRTGVLIACYLVYALRIRANDAIRLVRKKRPRAVQTSGQILCVQQFEHYILPQTVIFSTKEPLLLAKGRKYAEFTLRQYLYRQQVTLHGIEERVFREIPKIVYCICERLLKLCGCHENGGQDYRINIRPFYKIFLSYRLKKNKPTELTTPEEMPTEKELRQRYVLGQTGSLPLPMVEWRDPAEEVERSLESVKKELRQRYVLGQTGSLPLPMVEWRDPAEEVERSLESVSRITSTTTNCTIPAVQVHEAFVSDQCLPEDKQKRLKQLRNDINQRREAMDIIYDEEDPLILSGLLFEWLEGLKEPVLDREDLSLIVSRAHNIEWCIQALDMEDIILIEYLLRFMIRLRPLAANKKVDIIKRLISSLTQQTICIEDTYLPSGREFPKLREGTCSQIVNFMLRMIVEIQKDMLRPGCDEKDVVFPSRRLKIKAWK
ncbi:Protein tyrosine phosphatase domain-containing protein 1 [Papilio xuthus]|uniref:Protein tyrosine phosphatase domain-containing protein 1 n=1 Tax=Papilio xuthus TaxID=66420 RepID=A0A194Q5I2_PAPXU|nr:Protein tyrosine phosphatase domain-containing protein 1 [Papilio xuthus]